MTQPPRPLLPIAAWWHRLRHHYVRNSVIAPDNGNGPLTWWHTYCYACGKGWL